MLYIYVYIYMYIYIYTILDLVQPTTTGFGGNSEALLETRKYLLGCIAFSISPVVLQSFKNIPGQDSYSNEEEFFKIKLGSPRVRSEHCIGILKSRFPCPKTINIRIKGKDE